MKQLQKDQIQNEALAEEIMQNKDKKPFVGRITRSAVKQKGN